MLFECRKIWRSNWILLTSLVLFVLNTFVYCNSLQKTDGGNSFAQIRTLYEEPHQTCKKYETLLKEEQLYFETENEDLSFDYDELEVYHEAVERMAKAENYNSDIQQLLSENSIKISSGIFGDENSFAVKAMQNYDRIYQKMDKLTVPITFHGGIERFLSFTMCEISAVIMAILLSAALLMQEKREMIRLVLNCTENGKSVLYKKKIAAILMCTVLFEVVLLLMMFLASAMTGVGNLLDPIQSVYGMELCPYNVSILQYLLLVVFGRILVVFCISSFIVFLFSVTDNLYTVMTAIGLLCGAAFLLQKSNHLEIEILSFLQQIHVSELLSTCIYLNVSGVPVNRVLIEIAILFLYTIPACLGGEKLYNRPYRIDKNKRIWKREKKPAILQKRYEAYKFWVMNSAAVIAFLIVVTQCILYSQRSIEMTAYESFYRTYSEVLEGSPCTEKDEYLANEEVNIESMEESSLKEIRNLALCYAAQQYSSLNNEYYINRTGYEKLYDKSGKKRVIWHTFLLLTGIGLAVSADSSQEIETGMNTLISSYGQKRQTKWMKWKNYGMFILLLWCICFMPEYIAINHVYGLHYLTGKVSSLGFTHFRNIRIWQLLLLTNALILSTSFLYAGMIDYLSEKIGKKMIAACVAQICTVIIITIAFLCIS